MLLLRLRVVINDFSKKLSTQCVHLCTAAATGDKTLGTRLCLSRDIQVHGDVVTVQTGQQFPYASKIGDYRVSAVFYFSEIRKQALNSTS